MNPGNNLKPTIINRSSSNLKIQNGKKSPINISQIIKHDAILYTNNKSLEASFSLPEITKKNPYDQSQTKTLKLKMKGMIKSNTKSNLLKTLKTRLDNKQKPTHENIDSENSKISVSNQEEQLQRRLDRIKRDLARIQVNSNQVQKSLNNSQKTFKIKNLQKRSRNIEGKNYQTMQEDPLSQSLEIIQIDESSRQLQQYLLQSSNALANKSREKLPIPKQHKANNYIQSNSLNSRISKQDYVASPFLNVNDKKFSYILQDNSPSHSHNPERQISLNLNSKQAEYMGESRENNIFNQDKMSSKFLAPMMNQSFDQISQIDRQLSGNTNTSELIRIQSKDFSYKSFFHELRGLNTPQNADYKANKFNTINSKYTKNPSEITQSIIKENNTSELRSSYLMSSPHKVKDELDLQTNLLQLDIKPSVILVQQQVKSKFSNKDLIQKVSSQEDSIIFESEERKESRRSKISIIIDEYQEKGNMESQKQIMNKINLDGVNRQSPDVIHSPSLQSYSSKEHIKVDTDEEFKTMLQPQNQPQPYSKEQQPVKKKSTKTFINANESNRFQSEMSFKVSKNPDSNTISRQETDQQSINISQFKGFNKELALQLSIKQMNLKSKIIKEKSSTAFVYTCLQIYRIMLRFNNYDLLMRLVKNRFVRLAVKAYKQYQIIKKRKSLFIDTEKVKEDRRRSKKQVPNYLLKKQATWAGQGRIGAISPLIQMSRHNDSISRPSISKRSMTDSEIPMGTQEALYWFKQACLTSAIIAFEKLKVKIIFSNQNAIIDYSLELFRQMLMYNYQNLLFKLVKKRLVQMSVKIYQEYERQWERETIFQLFRKRIVKLAISIYYKSRSHGSLSIFRNRFNTSIDKTSIDTQVISLSQRIQQENLANSQQAFQRNQNQLSIQHQPQLDTIIQNLPLNPDAMVLKVSQAFLLEYESDEEDKQDSTQVDKQQQDLESSRELSSIDRNSLRDQQPRSSISSNFSNGLLMDSMMLQFKKIGDLDNASIPQLREIEKNIMLQQQRIQQEIQEIQGSSESGGNNNNNLSQRISTNYQTTTQGSQNNITQGININSNSNMNADYPRFSDVEKFESSITPIPFSKNSTGMNVNPIIQVTSVPVSSFTNDNNSHQQQFQQSQHEQSKMPYQQTDDEIKQQIFMNYGNADQMLEEESSQDSSSTYSKQSVKSGSNRSHSSFAASSRRLEGSKRSINNNQQKRSDPNPKIDSSLIQSKQQTTQIRQSMGEITAPTNKLLEKSINNGSSSNRKKTINQNYQENIVIKKQTDKSISRFSLNLNNQNQQRLPSSAVSNHGGLSGIQGVSPNHGQNSMNRVSQVNEPKQLNNTIGIQIKGTRNNSSNEQNTNANALNSSNHAGKSPRLSKTMGLVSQKKPKEEVVKLFKMFKDLDLQRQQMILRALEPHLIAKTKKHGNLPRFDIKMKRYSDFINRSTDNQ
ncbi:UNKNOWN [Stylonychia lemnae]|uniref:Uncharacterized protein n=1 Tax=Stylonychia lemnae TaxID=5949 RepID=A0A078B7S8_STYLE|nr:UNKNOWN [Stylonychia lemnae]|eukprot:CDW89608.1 UNKNOWN [Stylonychia lemnae]